MLIILNLLNLKFTKRFPEDTLFRINIITVNTILDKMVMMQSPISDTPQPASPCSSNPGSPKINNNTINSDNKYLKYESHPRLERPMPTKYDGILLARFQDHHAHEDMVLATSVIDIKNRPIIYTKDSAVDLENQAKFSIERLKQLTDHSINRLSPSEDSSNNSMKFSLEQKYGHLSPTTTTATVTATGVLPLKGCGGTAEGDTNTLHHSQLSSHHLFPLKYPTNNASSLHNQQLQQQQQQQQQSQLSQQQQHQLDIERIKLARTITNGKELSDFGFRIQLGGLHTNYARSDTSEELVVDGNDETSSQGGAPTVCFIYSNLCW